MADKKKPAIAIILSGLKKKQEESEVEESEYDMVAEELLSAVKDEDPKMLATVLKDFIYMCMNEEE